MKFIKRVTIELTKDEELEIIKWYLRNEPNTIKQMLRHFVDTGSIGTCPFPGECSKYPCKEMACNADTLLSNGYPRKGH